jgi:hypothetical protein
MVKAASNSEARMAGTDLQTAMGQFNQELIRAGVLLAGDALQPSSRGKWVRFSGGKRLVTDGPFADTKEVVAGYWLWQVKSMQEALEWVRRCPDPMPGEEAEIEIRSVIEAEDLVKPRAPGLQRRCKV